MVIIFLGIIIFLILIIPTFYGFITSAPIFFSPKGAIEEALQICQAKEDEKFFDLGMGTGRSLIIANKYKLKIGGYEMSPILFFIAKLNLQLHSIKKADLRLSNYYKAGLSQADIIFCFLSIRSMAKLKNKFESELRPGTRIISYAFEIHGWQPQAVISDKYPGKVYIYLKS